MTAAVALCLAAAQLQPGSPAPLPGAAPAGSADASGRGRAERFLFLLRTYPERPPGDTFQQLEQLIAQGPFDGRDRAEYWLGSAQLAAGDLASARRWFAQLARDAPGSVWEERSFLGLAEADARERRYGAALRWYARARAARDPAVRELGAIAASEVAVLLRRERLTWAATCAALLVAALFAFDARRAKPWPLPGELRIVWPALALFALLALRLDPSPRAAVLILCAGGAVLTLLSGLRLRALEPRGAARVLHAALALLAFACLCWVALERTDLVGMVQETLRAGPE